MQCLDLKPFERFVAGRSLVPERYRSYYVRWVQRFLRSEFSANELADRVFERACEAMTGEGSVLGF